MAHPNKPQLAFAWIGAELVLTRLWYALIETPVDGHLPRELMHHPQIIAAETETWSYRFSRCIGLSHLLYMRLNARRQAAVLWCKEGRVKPNAEEYKMLCYAGACQLPIVVFVQKTGEGTQEADQEEQEIRGLFDAIGFKADEAIFVYAPQTPQGLPSAILHLYQRLDQSLSVTAERSLPPLMLRCEELEILLFMPPSWDSKLGAIEIITDREKIPGALQETLRSHMLGSVTTMTVRIKFERTISVRPEQLLGVRVWTIESQEFLVQGTVILV